MRHDDIPTTRDNALSTEDLAQHRESDAARDNAPAPVYPGDSDEKAGTTEGIGSREADTPAKADSATKARGGDADEMPQLLSTHDEEDFRKRWEKIQITFVDDPREAVQAADNLVANVMQTLAATFDEHKTKLEGQLNQSGQADTEALRTALRHYRSFFNRLLTT
ncbi:hypothetical protein [Streptomyces broussonetiae]|uniref:Uncharacterized protein n=1 Tax=Streptomyces broussonetiae TaxID=2686304 RepID=A0A6I6MRJ0_9ACTN|nr:hypothetical protein [Streptomyces broussonetiae]QHA03178.1 hypothetical protein GQF42_07750 [Streptomyces broussonetiae]